MCRVSQFNWIVVLLYSIYVLYWFGRYIKSAHWWQTAAPRSSRRLNRRKSRRITRCRERAGILSLCATALLRQAGRITAVHVHMCFFTTCGYLAGNPCAGCYLKGGRVGGGFPGAREVGRGGMCSAAVRWAGTGVPPVWHDVPPEIKCAHWHIACAGAGIPPPCICHDRWRRAAPHRQLPDCDAVSIY